MAAKRWNQCQIILDAMRRGEGIDRVTAVQKYGVKSLGKIISMLRQEGIEFDMKYTRSDARRVLCEYSISKDIE